MPEFSLPIKGVSYGFNFDKQPPLTSGYMNNVRAICTFEKKVRIAQRPGLDKEYSQQIGGFPNAVVKLLSVTVVA